MAQFNALTAARGAEADMRKNVLRRAVASALSYSPLDSPPTAPFEIKPVRANFRPGFDAVDLPPVETVESKPKRLYKATIELDFESDGGEYAMDFVRDAIDRPSDSLGILDDSDEFDGAIVSLEEHVKGKKKRYKAVVELKLSAEDEEYAKCVASASVVRKPEKSNKHGMRSRVVSIEEA